LEARPPAQRNEPVDSSRLTLPTLVDTFGRVHNNLRISVTDRCNLRCVYCMPEDVTFLDRSELLTFEEIRDFVVTAMPLGINKVRLTGGEPLLRKDLSVLVRMLSELPGLEDLGLTTNGLLLARDATRLYEAGLRRLNVSLDTLDADRFRELTRRDGVELVVAGLTEAKRVGFTKIKVNAVAMRGYIEADIVPLARYCREQGFELRLIEYMPIGAEAWEREKCVLAHELLEILDREVAPLVPATTYDPHAPAQDFAYADGLGTLGIIASVSRPFCGSCNRIRLTAEGKLRNCLFALDETPVKHLLRPLHPSALQDAIRQTVRSKWAGHEINSASFTKPERTMHAIGG
jgi:GTP 3',8-cyclase